MIEYIIEVIGSCWWVALLMGIIAVLFMMFAPKEEEWESLDEYYNPNPFITDSSAETKNDKDND